MSKLNPRLQLLLSAIALAAIVTALVTIDRPPIPEDEPVEQVSAAP